jgi:hypothetical protein
MTMTSAFWGMPRILSAAQESAELTIAWAARSR